jgi:hypothetical protein
VTKKADSGAILIDRATWLEKSRETLPDGPTQRGKVQFILPDFGEPPEARIWFGGNLVTGVGGFDKPLRALRHAGNEAARLLLALYAANDMETWGGVRPVGVGRGPWERYELADEFSLSRRSARLIRARGAGTVASMDKRIGDDKAYWRALEALQAIGLVYEVVMVLNRDAIKAKFGNGGSYGAIPDDAEPYYELDARSRHGYKPEGEEGISGVTARTAGDFGRPLTEREFEGDGTPASTGTFNRTYAAIVPSGHQAMIAGIFRLRFRVANPKNAGIKSAWARIHQANREAFEFVQAVRAAENLPPLPAPWGPRTNQGSATAAEPETPAR